MPLSYKPCGSGGIPAHVCNGCIKTEQGGVRGAAFILASHIPRDVNGLISQQVEDFSWWESGINNGEIHVVPKTRGTFDGGSPTTSPGYGNLAEITTGKIFTAVMSDPDHRENEAFYEAMANAPGAYHFAWRTGNELRISDTTVNIDPVDNTEEDVNSQVVWGVTITWSQDRKTVQIFNLNKEIFKCFDQSGDTFYTTPQGFALFSSKGGSTNKQTLAIASTIGGNAASVSIQGTPPTWVHASITESGLEVYLDENSDESSRNYQITLSQTGGKTLAKIIQQAAASYVLTIGSIPTQPASGGNVTVPVTSTLNGTAVGWTFNSAGSTSGITIVSGEGTASPVFNIPVNTGTQRNLTIAIKQSVGTKTATKTIVQSAYVAPTGNMYVGGTVSNELITTEAEVKALLLDSGGTNPIKTNVQKGDTVTYITPAGIMKSYVVQPANLGKPESFYDLDADAEYIDIDAFKDDGGQITVDGVVCNVYYLQYFESAAGYKNVRVTS
jgi:hypothetical protein